MAIRLQGSNCWVATSSGKEDDREVVFMYCQSRLRGVKCPHEDVPGATPFVLGPKCFEQVQRGKARK
jgi:hypothetical protein